MPRAINRLSARQVASQRKVGMHADGGGLYLRVTKKGSRQWVFVFHWQERRREMGLGGVDGVAKVDLTDARKLAAAAREKLADKRNPIDDRQAAEAGPKAGTGDTFGEVAEALVAGLEAGWKNAKHKAQWRSTLKTYCAPIWAMNVGDVATDDVVACIRPIWMVKPETAERVRGRMERVLDAAVVHGKRSRELANPARWKGHLALILPPKQKLSRGHHAAMPYSEVPAFWPNLRQRPALAARCLELTMLCGLRTNEALGARKAEFDLTTAGAEVWTVPPERMKGKKGHKREHRIPLGGRALAIVREALADTANTGAYLFPSAKNDARPMSNMAMEMLMRRMGYGDEVIGRNKDGSKKRNAGDKANYTVHGFRSAFRDWGGEATEFPDWLLEMCLAHVVGNAVERAYRRGDALDKRREVLEAWDGYVTGGVGLALAAE